MELFNVKIVSLTKTIVVCDSSAHVAVAQGAAPVVEADHRRLPALAPPNHRAPGLPDPVHAPIPDLDPGNVTAMSTFHTLVLLLFLCTGMCEHIPIFMKIERLLALRHITSYVICCSTL